jgi:hypothetical protein
MIYGQAGRIRLRNAGISCLKDYRIRNFNQEIVLRGRIPQLGGVIAEHEFPFGTIGSASLRPYQVKGGAGFVFPPENKVRPELQEMEIRVIKTKISSAAISIHKVLSGFAVVLNFAFGILMKSVVIFIRIRIGDGFKFGIVPCKIEGLTVKLQRHIRCYPYINSGGKRKLFTIEAAHNVIFIRCIFVDCGNILQIIVRRAETGRQGY